MKETAIDERIFIETEIGVREGKVVATGSERGVGQATCSDLDIASNSCLEGDYRSGT